MTKTRKKKEPRSSADLSTLEDFLKEEGTFEEFEAIAVKEVLDWQIAKGTKPASERHSVCRRDKRSRSPHLRAPRGVRPGFTKRYGLKRLVYFEQFDDIRDAIQREHNIKHWPRAWKVRKIIAVNPAWDDLYETIVR